MEHSLRCNALKCRRELDDKAIVTTCSHIFCLDCADSLQLSHPPLGQRPVCPACHVHLDNPDDAVITNLKPTEDYKTSVLSGLSPIVIMECAGRALSFWAYQSTQEIVYHVHIAKGLTEKYMKLNSGLDNFAHAANSEITELRGKVTSLHDDQVALCRKHEELSQAYKEMSHKQMQTQELYDKLKRLTMLGQVQDAASEAVDDSIQASVIANRFANHNGDENQTRQSPPLFSEMRTNELHQPRVTPVPVGIIPGRNRGTTGSHPNIFGSREAHHTTGHSITPSSHRQHLANLGPPPTHTRMRINNQQTRRQMSQAPSFPRISPSGRSPLGGLTGNVVSGNGFAGYGMSAGVKFSQTTSRMQNLDGGDPGRQTPVPPRIAQRSMNSWG